MNSSLLPSPPPSLPCPPALVSTPSDAPSVDAGGFSKHSPGAVVPSLGKAKDASKMTISATQADPLLKVVKPNSVSALRT